MRKFALFTALVITASTIGGGFVHAQNFGGSDMDSRMDRLERDISTLSRAVYKGDLSQQPQITQNVQSGPALESNYRISLENRLSAMEQQIRSLTGQIEEMNFRLNRMENAAPSAAQGAPRGLAPHQIPPGLNVGSNAPQANAQPSVTKPPLTISSEPLNTTQPKLGAHTEQPNADSALSFGTNDVRDYESAFSSLKKGDYAGAQDRFKAFLETHKGSSLEPNALYWLGETYYVQKQFQEAARIFARGYQDHPKSNKGPDNLLKLGLSLSGMGKKEDACIALMQLVKSSSNETPVLSRAKQESKKLGCN